MLEKLADDNLLTSIKFRRLTASEEAALSGYYLLKVGKVVKSWILQTSDEGEIYGFRLFQSDPRDFDDGFIEIRSYNMNNFKIKPDNKYVAKLTLNVI